MEHTLSHSPGGRLMQLGSEPSRWCLQQGIQHANPITAGHFNKLAKLCCNPNLFCGENSESVIATNGLRNELMIGDAVALICIGQALVVHEMYDA